MSHLYKSLRENTAILWIQSGWNRLQAKKSIKTNLHFRRHTLWPFNSHSTRLWRRLVSKAAAVEMVVALKEGHLPDKILLVTIVVKRAISIKTVCQQEMALSGTHPRNLQMSFQKGLLESLLSQIPKFWQQPPRHATTRSTNGAPLVIMVRVHGEFIGRMATRSEKINKARSHMFVFPTLPKM